jgi:hypothetical protein
VPVEPTTIPDSAVVDRFNELVKEKRIDFRGYYDAPKDMWKKEVGVYEYRLRPTPQYRPFNAVEAAGHIKRRVKLGELNGSSFEGPFMAGEKYIQVGEGSCKRISYDDAVAEVTFTDTGLPFGVKVSE